MYSTDSCRFLISFGFQVYCTPFSYHTCAIIFSYCSAQRSWNSVGPGFEPECWQWKRSNRKSQHPDSNQGHTDLKATTEPLSQAGLLILNWTECTVILTGWVRGLKSQTRFKLGTPRLRGHHWTTEPGRLAYLGPMYIKPPIDMVFIRPRA